MGNKTGRAVCKKPRVATLQDILSLQIKFKFDAVGVDKADAVAQLKEICTKRGLPEIQPITNFPDQLFCGYFRDKGKLFYNPVMYGYVQDEPHAVTAIVWWNPKLTPER